MTGKFFSGLKTAWKQALLLVKEYPQLLRKPIIFSFSTYIIWYFIFRPFFSLNPENVETMSAIIGGVLVFSAILPLLTVSRVAEQFREMQLAVADYILAEGHVKQDEIQEEAYINFRRNLKRGVGVLERFAVFGVITFAVAAVMMVPYESFWVGSFFVVGIALVHSYCWYAAAELDNPKESCKQLRVPNDWLVRLKKESEILKEFFDPANNKAGPLIEILGLIK